MASWMVGQAEALPGTEEDEDDVQEESEEEEEDGLYDEWCEELMQPGLPPNKKAKVDPAMPNPKYACESLRLECR